MRYRVTAAALLLALASATAHAQVLADNGFTYQGRLTDAGAAPTGQYDIQFTLWDASSGGTPNGTTITLDNVPVTAGLFTARLDFGTAFGVYKRWLQLAVRPGVSTGAYTTLLPRQEVTAAPFATYALGPWQTVTGQAYPNNGFYLRAGDGSYFGMDSDYGDLHVNGGNDGSFGITSDGIASGSFNISTGGAARFTIRNDTGNVGVGTTNPGAKLEVESSNQVAFRATSNGSLGVIGRSYTNAAGANGVYGEVLPLSSASGGDYSAGVAGSNFTSRTSGNIYFGVYGVTQGGLGIGVCGQGNGVAKGVVGTSLSNTGTEGNSTSGPGVVGASVNGQGVVGTSTTSYGLKGVSSGTGIGGAGLLAQNVNPSGIAIVTSTNSTDANTVIVNTGAGDLIRCFSGGGGGNQVFTVTNCGTAIAKVIQIQGGCDVAEPFHVGKTADQPAIEPGMVVVIDPENPGSLMLTDRPNDTRVAGIISGANGLAPGLTLSSDDHAIVRGEHPVAMTGRVWCRVDADLGGGAIKPGDMLTTSTVPGTAMKAVDASQSRGAVIGKAMTGLKDGRGLVLVLVNLQ